MTTPVVLTGQLNELVLVSNSAKNVTIATINDILQKTPGGNTLGIDPGDTATFHSYDVRTGICLVTNPNCTVENVFEALKRYPAPGATGESIYDGATTNIEIGPFGAGPVVHYLDPDGNAVINVTTSGHLLYPGLVFRQVYQDGDLISVQSIGFGNGPYPAFNAIMADTVWGGQNAVDIMHYIEGLTGASPTFVPINYNPSSGQTEIQLAAYRDGSRASSETNAAGQRIIKEAADGSQTEKISDSGNTHPYNEVDLTKGADGKVTTAQVTLDPTLLAVGSTVGQIFGSELGAALGGKDQLGKLVGSVAGGTIGSLIGQKFVQVLATSMTADLSKVSLTDVFALKGVDIANAGIGAVSSFLTAELGTALNIHGFSGTLFNIAGSSLTFSVLSQVVNSNLSFDAAIAAIDWSQAVSGAYNAAQLNLDGVLGSYLAHEFVPAKTHEGAVGGELLGAIGNFILPGGLGSLIGTILGTLIGNQFGTTPSPGAVDLIDQAGYYYNYHEYQSSDHGSYTAPDAMAPAADIIINAYLRAVNGAALDHSKQAIVGYIQNPDLLFLSGTPGHPDHSFTSANDAVHAAALDVLQNTEVVGGDLLLKRAHHNSPSNDPQKAPGGGGLPGQPQFSAAEQLVTMSGDLSVAQDYETYLDNREAINALIAMACSRDSCRRVLIA